MIMAVSAAWNSARSCAPHRLPASSPTTRCPATCCTASSTRTALAPNGGNRQPWHVIVVRDQDRKRRLAALWDLAQREDHAFYNAGLVPFVASEAYWRNPPGGASTQPIDLEAARATPLDRAGGTRPETIVAAPVVLLVTVDLSRMTAMDSGLGRLSISAGGSVYPFAHNILLAARDAGYGGVVTTVLVRRARGPGAVRDPRRPRPRLHHPARQACPSDHQAPPGGGGGVRYPRNPRRGAGDRGEPRFVRGRRFHGHRPEYTHRELAEVARSFLAGQKARASARALLDAPEEGLPPFWSALADLGWLGLHLPEEHGGSGYGLAELAVVLEEIGRAVAPGPFLTTVTASAVVADLADPATKARLLPGLGDGSVVAGVGLRGSLAVEGGVVTGDAGVVLGAGGADLLVLVAGDDVLLLPAGRAGLVVTPAANLDPTRRAGGCSWTVSRWRTGSSCRAPAGRAVDLARTLAAAEAAGGARECVEMASGYAKVREQFGRVIATFGAVKHHCADMLVAAEIATAAVWDGGRRRGRGPPPVFPRRRDRRHRGDPRVSPKRPANIQVHGGIGFTWEHDGHMLLRRAAASPPFSLRKNRPGTSPG